LKTIGEYRARYPQLRELTDYQLTRAVYDTTAPDMPLEDFAKAFGGVTEEDPEEVRIQEYNLSHPDDTIRREDMGKASLLSDTGHGIAAGINELAAIPFWLAEEAGIESAGKAKDYFLKSAEEKRKGYSPEMKLARAEEFFTEEPDGSYGFGGAWTSPRKILGSVAESAPGMVGGMGLSALAARGLMKAGFSRGLAWAVGSSLGEGTIGGAQNALDVHEAILAMPEDKLAASPEYQEILQRTGDPKRAREELANSVAAMTGLKTGASTAVLSAPSGYMFGKILGGETGKTLLGTAAKQGAAEFGEEAGQSGAEQYLSQAELQRADPTIDPMSGVGEAAVSGGFAGMAMGGGMGGFGHVLGGRAQQQPGAPAVSDAQPVLPPEQQAALPEGGHGSPLELGPGQNIVMGTDRAYEDPIATPPPTSPLQKGMEAILGGPLGLSTAPAAPDFAVTPGGRAVSANGIVQPDAFGPIAAGMRSDMPPLLADQVYDVEYSVVPGAPKALSEAPRGLPLGQDKSPVAPESPQPVDAQANGGSAPLQLTRINDKSFMLHGDTAPFEAAIKAAGGRLDRNVGGWRFPLAREGEIRELFGIPLGAETVPGDNLVSEVPEASPEVLRETPLPVSGDMAMSGQTGLEVTHGGLQQGTPGAGTGELLSESVPVDAAGNPGELAAAARGSGRYHGDLGNRPDLDTALPGVDGREAGLGAAVQRTAGSVEVPGEGRGQNVSFNQIPTIPDSGRSASGRGDEPAFRGLPEVGRDVSGGSKGTKNASFEKNGRKGIERKLLRAIERQQGGVSPEAEAWAHGLNPQERKKAYEQLVLNEFKRHTASELGVDEESLRFIPVRKDSETSLRLKEIGGVFGQDVVIFKDSSSVQTGIRGASVPTIEHVVFMEGSAEREKPYLFVLGHELLHRMRSEDLKAYKQFQEYLLDDLQEDAIPRYRENLDRRTGGDGTVARMSDEAILEEIGADLVGKRLTEESFWAKMAEERPSLFARVSQFVRDLLDRVTAAFRADPLPAAWVKDFDAIRRHIDAMMGQWAEKIARAKTGGTPPHSGNTREVLDGRDETVRNAGRNGGEGSDHAGGLLQSNRGRHGAPVDLVGDGGRGGDRGRAAQPAPEGREGERPRQPVAVKIPNRADEPAHYELLEADDVRASHLPSRGFQKNPAYGLENERRYHDEPGSRAKVMENAARLDPAFLMESVDANHGAPVIDHDNNVLGGNGRAMSIARAYESFPERGRQYREALKANAARLGIDPAQVDAMRSPVLVRRLERGMSPEERQKLVSAMNDDFKDAKEKRASGKSRGDRFGRRTLDMLASGLKDAESLRQYFDTPASASVVERMLEDGVIQRSERNALVGADGLLNPDGKKVVEEALRGRIARSYETLAKLPADVVGKLDAVIPHILVAEGIGKPWDITEHVRDSVDLLVGFKGSGVKEPDIYLKQVNMLTGKAPVQDFSKQAIALFRMALDAKKGEYVKAFESYLKNAKLSPEAGNIPGIALPQDRAFRQSFGMEEEAVPSKPEKRASGTPQAKEKTEGRPPEKAGEDAFGTAFPAFSGKPKEAIEHLLKVKEGHVPAAFHKEGLGDIDLPWGKEGKKGFGLAHIIERRNEQGVNGVDFVRQLPHMIRDGSVEHRENYPNRAYIVSKDNETVIRLEWDGKRRAWLLTAYPLEENGSRSSDRTTDLDQTRVAGKTPPGNSESVERNISSEKQAVNSEHSASLVTRHHEFYKSLLTGKATLEAYRNGFSDLLKNEEAVRAELSGMTVKELLERGGAVFAWQHKGDKKADIVDALYRDMLSDFTLGQSYSVSGMMGMSAEAYRKATEASIRRIVDAQTEQTLADFAKSAAAQREEYAGRHKAAKEAVENPKTLDDFRAFMRFHMDGGKTATEARDLLSFEQRERFDRLAAEASRSSRKTKAEPVLSSASQTTGGEIIAAKHTQKGHDLFVVRLGERVSREDYLALLSSAKRLGGYYSKFRGNGAVPGFQFTEREQAEAFLKLAQGDKAEAQEAIQARRDAFEDDRSQTAVQRLNEMADRLDEDADAGLNAARKVNTAKRARQAASADAMAYADKALAKTMRNIAGAIEDGTATFLDRVREKKQVELLRDDLRRAKWEEDKTKYPDWEQREKHSEEPATTSTVEFAAFPHYRLYRSSWAELGRKLSEKDGTKSLGKKILSVADDVTETYLEFARSHLEEVSTYATQAGKPAVFKSREDAEKAIARSGYRGKAVVLPVKRGENRIILSPSAAQERGIWKGDDDRMLSLRPDLVDELFDKQGSTSRDIPWQLSDIRQKRKALARMGIETPAEYRMALREFVGLQAAAKQDKVRELERSVMRDAANNRGWLDFFPTPVAVTEEMLAAADIRPGMAVLEPSAGMGHIADRIREQGVEPVVAELEPQKRELLEAKGYEVVGKDFMELEPKDGGYDRIVMNPPFSKRQDTEHVRRAYDLLNPGGRLVAIVSEGSFFGKDKKASEFRDWLEEAGGTSEKLAEGSFNDPALPVTTGVNTRMVIIEKKGMEPLASLREDSTPVTVVEVEPGIVPEFKKIGELVKWLKGYFSDKRTERIESTQKVVLFSNTGLSASTKRVREPGNREAYGRLNDLVRKAAFERFEPNDVRHPHLGGQEIYYSAMRLGDRLYAVRLSLDVPSEAEVDTRRKIQPESEIEDLRFKGHELKEIEIAPITENYGFEGHTAIEAIREISLGVLRDAVKPSRLENGVLSSITPGEFLPEAKASRLRVRKAAVQSVADALGKRAANAADTRVVQSFEELPEHIRELYGEVSSRLEGVYDPASGTVYLVADNLVSSARAAEVWMHENMVHHGINGLLGEREKVRLLNQMWKSMGGMGNPQIAAISKKYGLDPRSDTEGRALIMEEVLASLAEKRAADKLSGQDQTYWRRFVDAVLRAWHALADAVTGRTGSMKYENVDRLLAALDAFVFEGRPEGVEQGGLAPAMASKRSDPNNARFSPDTGKKTDFVTLPDGSVDFAQFPATRLKDMRLLRAAPIRLERGVHSMEGGQGLRHIEANHGDEIRAAGYGSVQEFVWDLVNGYNEIWEGEGKSLLLLKNNGTDSRPAGFIELERNGSFYKVKNAYPVDRNYPTTATRKQLWKSAPPSSIATGEQSPSIPVSGHRNPFQDQTGNLQGQRGQSGKKNIQQGREEGKPLASLKTILDMTPGDPKKAEAGLDEFERNPDLKKLVPSGDLSLARRIFGLPHWIAKNYPEFSAIYERQLKRREERAAQLQKTLEQVPSLFGDKTIRAEDMDDLKRLIWDNNGKQIRELKGVEKFRAVLDEEGNPELLGNTEREELEMNPEYLDGYRKWLDGQRASESAKKAMLEIRHALDESFLRSYNTLGAQQIDDSLLQEMRTRVGHIHNYFPMHRYGDYYLHGYTQDSAGKNQTVYREHFDAATEGRALKQANRRMRELEKLYPGTKWAWGKVEKFPEEWFGTPVKSEALQQIIDASIKRIDDKELAGKIEGVLSAAVADTIKMRGWGSHLIGRKAIPGFEREDISRVLHDYLSGQTGWLTKMEATKDFTTLLGEIKSTKKSGLWSYSVNYVEDMLRNSDKVDRIVGNMKAAAFLYFLGGNLKTAAVNLTQNIVVGVPMLHMDVKGPVVGYWKAALNTLGKQVFTRTKFSAGHGLSEDEASMLNELYMEDVTTEGYLRDIRGRIGSRSSRMFGKAMRATGYFMEVAERFNRASLALAAYRAARDGRLTDAAQKHIGISGPATHAQAKSYAAALVKDAHYVYGKDNLPEPLRHSQAGRVLSPVYTFRAFSHNYISGLLYAIRSRGAAGWAMAARSLGGLMALGGLTSFPFYASVMALCQAVSGDDDDWTQQIRKALPESDWLRDIVCYGLPSLGGAYIGGSLRIETPIERGIKPGATPKDILTDSLGSVIGIPYSVVEIVSRMMEAGRGGDPWRVLEEAAPVALKNAMSAYRLSTEGQTTMRGRPIVEDGQPRRLTTGEAVGKVLGFQPVSSTKNYDRYRAGQHAELVRREKADEIATKMFRARQENDSAARKEAREAFVEWNDKMRKEGKPDMLIRPQDIERRVRERMRPKRPSARERAREERME